MTAENFDRAYRLVAEATHEPDAPWGITRPSWDIWFKRPMTDSDIEALTIEDAAEPYRQSVWKAIRGDYLPAGVDLAILEIAVEDDPVSAIRALQVAVDAPNYEAGIMGPMTLRAANEQNAKDIINRLSPKGWSLGRALAMADNEKAPA